MLLERRQLPGVQLRDRRRFGRDGPGRHARQHGAQGRRQLVPRLRCSATTRRRAGRRTTAGRPGVGQPCTGKNLTGDTTFNKTNNFLTNVSKLTKNYDFEPRRRRADRAATGRGSTATFRYLGVNKTVVDSFYNLNPQVPGKFTPYAPDTSRPGIDDGHIRSFAGRVKFAAVVEGQGLVLPRRAGQGPRPLGHRVHGSAGSVGHSGDADQLRVRDEVDADAEQQAAVRRRLRRLRSGVPGELSARRVRQPGAARIRSTTTATGKIANAWNNPADHFSKLFTEQFAANYITGAHSLRGGIIISQAQWRLAQQYTRRRPAGQLTTPACRCRSRCRIPTDRRNSIKEDMGLFIQDKWTINRATINAGVRYDQFIGATDPETLPAGTFNSAVTYSDCPDGKNNLNAGCTGRVHELEGHQPARRHRLRPLRQRQDRDQGERRALRRRHGPRRGQHRRQQQPRNDRRPHRHACVERPRQERIAVRRRPATSSSTS